MEAMDQLVTPTDVCLRVKRVKENSRRVTQFKIQIKRRIKSISGPSNVFYLCPGRVHSFSWSELVPLWMTEEL